MKICVIGLINSGLLLFVWRIVYNSPMVNSKDYWKGKKFDMNYANFRIMRLSSTTTTDVSRLGNRRHSESRWSELWRLVN